MDQRRITPPRLEAFRLHLVESEKSPATIEKYIRDVRRFAAYAAGRPVTRGLIAAYRAQLGSAHAVSSANSMLAALNAFVRFMGWMDLHTRQFRQQRSAYLPEEKELTRAEYERLVRTAYIIGNDRLGLILQTLCATGMRVSELPYITVEALHRGEATVRSKGKTRTVFVVSHLRKLLLRYARAQGIADGPVFITRRGRPVSRIAIWRDMKALCRSAQVNPGKVFPHNLRHLFARIFYSMEKDIARLADVLGHSSINTTRIYLATTGAEHRRSMEQMRLVLPQTKTAGIRAGWMVT